MADTRFVMSVSPLIIALLIDVVVVMLAPVWFPAAEAIEAVEIIIAKIEMAEIMFLTFFILKNPFFLIN